MSCIMKNTLMQSSPLAFPGITRSTPSTTRTCGSSGIGPNTSWLSCRDACFSTTTPNSACPRSERWRRWREPKTIKLKTTSPPRPTEIKPHVRTCLLVLSLLRQQPKHSLVGTQNIFIGIVMMVISCPPVFADVFLQTFYQHYLLGTTNRPRRSVEHGDIGVLFLYKCRSNVSGCRDGLYIFRYPMTTWICHL